MWIFTKQRQKQHKAEWQEQTKSKLKKLRETEQEEKVSGRNVQRNEITRKEWKIEGRNKKEIRKEERNK